MKASFQVILIIVFLAAAVFGVLVFSGAIPLGGVDAPGGQGTVVVWGTVKSGSLNKPLDDFNKANPAFVVKYVEKSADTFDQDLLEALAEGTGPDMFFLPDNLTYHYANKITTIPYTTYPLATFKSTFAGAGEVFLSGRGVLAFPMAIDPMVMYYSRSILDSSGVASPPTSWDEFIQVIPAVTKKDDANKIIRSGAALGHFANINHAKDILATLFMQMGNPIVAEERGSFQSKLGNFDPQSDISKALEFYTEFADPNRTTYSWNRSFPASRDAFSSENLAFYFGFASELPYLVNRNPNQNFFVAPLPQLTGSNFKLTGAHVTGLAILSSSKNITTAFTAASQMATGPFAEEFRKAVGVAPARRNLLANKPRSDAYSPIFYESALFSRSWLDPSDGDTDDIFRRMIEGVLSNSISAENAIRDANTKLGIILSQGR